MADGGLLTLDATRPGTGRPAPCDGSTQRQGPPATAGAAVGLLANTAVMSAQGIRRAGDLAPGDRVMTRDRGFRPLRGIAASRPAPELPGLHRLPEAVHIRAGALGGGLPEHDLLLAPRHRLLLARGQAERLFGAAELLVTARDLTGLPGILRSAAPAGADFVMPICERHELIWAEGLWCETQPVSEDDASCVRPQLQGRALRMLRPV